MVSWEEIFPTPGGNQVPCPLLPAHVEEKLPCVYLLA